MRPDVVLYLSQNVYGCHQIDYGADDDGDDDNDDEGNAAAAADDDDNDDDGGDDDDGVLRHKFPYQTISPHHLTCAKCISC